MDKTSTHQPATAAIKESPKLNAPRPTIEFLKQFARAYLAVPEMPGLVLN